MRDHTKLEAYRAADELAVAVYSAVRKFPVEERFGLASQMRRAAVSAAANIVEGSARPSAADYARFLSIAYASAREVQYEIDLAHRLGYLKPETADALRKKALSATRLLNRLTSAVKSFKA